MRTHVIPKNPVCQCFCLLLVYKLVPGWEGHLLQTDAAQLIHLQREVDEVWILFVAVYIYQGNFLFTCLLLGTVLTASVSDMLLNQKRFYFLQISAAWG